MPKLPKNLRIKLTLIAFLFLLVSIPLSVYVVKFYQENQNLSSKAAVPTPVPQLPVQPTIEPEPSKYPEYKKGELLVKFKENVKEIKTNPDRLSTAGDVGKTAVSFNDIDTATVPLSLHAVSQKAKIEKIEKLFKNIGNPDQEVTSARNRFKNEIANNTRHIDEQLLTKVNLSKWYKIYVSQDADLKKLVNDFKPNSEIEAVELNYKVHADQTGIVHQETISGASSNSLSVSTDANIEGVKDILYITTVAYTSNAQVLQIKGIEGLTWKKIKTQCSGRGTQKIESWYAIGTPAPGAYPGPVQASFETADKNAVITVSIYSNVDSISPIGAVISGNTKGLNGTCTGGIDSDLYNLNLATQFSSSYVYGSITTGDKLVTPGSDFTERVERHQGSGIDSVSVADQDKLVTNPSSNAVNGSLSGAADWSLIAFEIKIAGTTVPTNTPTPTITSTPTPSVTVAPPPPGFTNDTYSGYQWALNNTGQTGGTDDKDIDAPEAWQITKGSSNVIIAVIDTGIDYTHPDLGGCIGPNCKVVGGYDFVNNDADPMDDMGHGTHVAGIAAASTNNNSGIAGTCPDCKLMALKFLDKYGSGFIDDAVEAIEFAVINGAKILNNSWGGGGYNQSLQDAIIWATANGAGFIASAGNNPIAPIAYPAAMDTVLSVAATDYKDDRTSYTTAALWVDMSAPGGAVSHIGCRYPPGEAIFSTISSGTIWDTLDPNCTKTENNGKYAGLSGTSMASPYVSGAAGLLLSKNPTWKTWLALGQVKYTTDPIFDERGKPTYGMGTGRINAHKALTTTTSEPKITYNTWKYFVIDYGKEYGKEFSDILWFNVIVKPVNEKWVNGIWEPGEDADLFVELHNELAPANSISGVLTTTDQTTQVLNGNSLYPNMDSGDFKTNTTGFRVRANSSMVPGTIIPFNLRLTYKDSLGAQRSAEFEVKYTMTYEIGWPRSAWNISPENGEIADLNLDGKAEVLLSQSNMTKAYFSDGPLMWVFYHPWISGKAAIGNIDEDPKLEVVMSTTTPSGYAYLIILGADGKLKWYKEFRAFWLGQPSLVDLDKDGILDIVVGISEITSDSTPMLTVLRTFRGDGSTIWSRTGPYQDVSNSAIQGVSNSAIGDLDRNGTLELVTSIYTLLPSSDPNPPNDPMWAGSILVTNAKDGTDYQTTIDFPHPIGSPHPPLLADVNNNGDLEIIVKTDRLRQGEHKIHVFDKNGNLLPGWPKDVTNPAGISKESKYLSLSDIDSDGKVEIFYNDNIGKYYGFRYDGTNLPGWPVTVPEGDMGPQIIGDIDGDNKPEALWGGICKIYAFEANGQAVAGYPRDLTGPTCLDPNVQDPISIKDLFLGKINDRTHLGVAAKGWIETGFLIDTQKLFNPGANHWPVLFHDNQNSAYYKSVLLTPTVTPIVQVTPTPSLLSLEPIADAFVNANLPSQNTGRDGNLVVKAGPEKISYLKFDLKALSGKIISKAKLKIWVSNLSSGIMNIKRVSDNSWTESAINYNNKPALGTNVKTFVPESQGIYKEIDLTNFIKNNLGKVISIAIQTLDTNEFEFKSREFTDLPKRPVLIIQ